MPEQFFGSVRVFSPAHGRDEVLARLRERVPDLAARLDLERVVLFGSYASGRYDPGSDVDVLVVHRGPTRVDAYAVVRDALDLEGLEPHVIDLESFRRVERTWNRMVAGGVDLYPSR